MHSSSEDIKLCSIDQFGRTEPNFLKNNQGIIKKFGKVRRDKIELVRLSSVRFGLVPFMLVTLKRLN